MSEPKFRAWDSDFQIMWDFDFTYVRAGDLLVPGRRFCRDISDLKIMQYIGEDCKDRNEKEYCEDDLIKDNKNLYVVVRRQERFCIQSILSKEIYSFSSFGGFEAFEIIGNIHQNPELLK